MKSALAKARDNWLMSEDGKECCGGQASGKYLQNRLERAFLAGANFSSERIKEIEELLQAYREKRMYDGLNGRVWHADEHWQAEQKIKELEQALKGE